MARQYVKALTDLKVPLNYPLTALSACVSQPVGIRVESCSSGNRESLPEYAIAIERYGTVQGMNHSDTPLSRAKLYQEGIPITIVDPEERAGFASQALEFKAVNNALMPEDEDSRTHFLAELSAFIKTGNPGNFVVVEENLRELYLVFIGAGHRISRKIYATHPLIPGKLLVIGGVGIVRPDELNHRLTLQTPQKGMTLHRMFPDLMKISMSAGCPTPRKTVASVPNVDPVGGYSSRTAERKYRYVEMISEGKKGIDPLQFPVIANVAWGTVGVDLAFYVYAVPDNATPVCELLYAASREQVTAALGHYMAAGQALMRALRHLHEAGYVFNQAHQGNIYYYQDIKGEDKILIADLDMLQSIKDFSPKVPEGKYLSPRAFATLVNIQVASTNIAHMAWITFVQGMIKQLGSTVFPDIDQVYASIIVNLLSSYIAIPDEKQRSSIYTSIRSYFTELDRQVHTGANESRGIMRLINSDLYETDVFGFLFTYILMNDEYCKTFGARLLTDGINRKDLTQMANISIEQMKDKANNQLVARALNQAMSQLIEERSTLAMQEFIQAFTKEKIRNKK
ncbi:MAG: hypothetical protein ACYCZF_06825 [Anaerolineae bacterium]